MTFPIRSIAAAFALAIFLAPHAARAQHAEMPMLGRWTGTFRSVLMTQETRNAGGDIGHITGETELQPTHESGLDLYIVKLRISTNAAAESLEWGVSMGRCGSKLIMLENANQLPSIETRSGGEGELRHTLALNMDAKHTYQVGLFRNGHAQQNMIACANLKYDDRMR